MSDVTRILSQIESGDPSAAEQLLPLVYDELRKLAAAKLAQEKPGQTLQATALVHEAYLRLLGQRSDASSEDPVKWDSRGHFFAAAAEAMRRILINRARDKGRQKRERGLQRVDLDAIEIALDTPADDLLALDEALQELAATDKLCADLVQLRFFAGLSLGEAAEALGMPRRTADRHWAYARAWLFDWLQDQE
jgi:RNA polymerase sigma factor (TIGR02999 family)